MKKFFIIFLVMVFCMLFCSCDYNMPFFPGKNSDTLSSAEENAESNANLSSEPEESPIQKAYRFVISPYTATSKREAFDTVYECEYFFLDGVVAGIHATTTLPNKSMAEAYLETVMKEDPLAEIVNTTVSYYSYSEDFYFDGYTPEKLQFALEKAGYEVVINFDLKEFNKNFGSLPKK